MNFTPKKTLRAVNFICNAPQAQSVSLVGDFNNWNPAAHRMKQMPDRAWLLMVTALRKCLPIWWIMRLSSRRAVV